jgi:galactokinase
MANIDFLREKINNGDNGLFRSLYGNDHTVLKEQSATYFKLIERFKSVFKNDDVELFSSPGRTEIGGNHTDHNHGRVLAGSVSIDNIAVAAKNNSSIIRIESSGYPSFEVDITGTEPREDERFTSSSLVRGVAAGLLKAGYVCGGFDAIINGRVPKGSGLSSSASFEVLTGTIINHLFNEGRVDPIRNAIIGQFAENNYFGKPCGLMDQTACAVGGLISIDFRDPARPGVKKVDFDFTSTEYSLVITDTGGDHADLNEDYASLPAEMRSVAAALGANVLRDVTMEDILAAVPELRSQTGDRAVLRAFHFQGDNLRVVRQVEALEKGDFRAFLDMVVESGYSSFMYNQNIYSARNTELQGVALGLAVSEMILKGKGAWRVHGGGFAGTIQAFVPDNLLAEYVETMEHIFGKASCHNLFIRNHGAIKLDFKTALA